LKQNEKKKDGCRCKEFSYHIFFSIKVPAYPNWKYRLPTTSELAEQEQTLLRKPIKEGLNSVPTTQKEKTDCAILLSPSQLFKVVVGKKKREFLFLFFLI